MVDSLTQLRARYKLSQSDLAVIAGVAQPNIAAIESDRRRLTPQMYARIEAAVLAWADSHAERAERAVQAAFAKPHLVALRNEHLQEQ